MAACNKLAAKCIPVAIAIPPVRNTAQPKIKAHTPGPKNEVTHSCPPATWYNANNRAMVICAGHTPQLFFTCTKAKERNAISSINDNNNNDMAHTKNTPIS